MQNNNISDELMIDADQTLDHEYNEPPPEEQKNFASTVPRRLSLCVADIKSCMGLIEELMRVKKAAVDGDSQIFVAADAERTCEEYGCVALLATATNHSDRDLELHRLHHGTIKIQVRDLYCTDCRIL